MSEAKNDLYEELDGEEFVARYWRFRSLDIGGINDVIAERLRFDEGRIRERQPVSPHEDIGGSGEDPSVQPAEQSGDYEQVEPPTGSTAAGDTKETGD